MSGFTFFAGLRLGMDMLSASDGRFGWNRVSQFFGPPLLIGMLPSGVCQLDNEKVILDTISVIYVELLSIP